MRIGVGMYAKGKWKNIKRDPRFSEILYRRTAVDLKDKWRNVERHQGDLEVRVDDNEGCTHMSLADIYDEYLSNEDQEHSEINHGCKQEITTRKVRQLSNQLCSHSLILILISTCRICGLRMRLWRCVLALSNMGKVDGMKLNVIRFYRTS